VGFFSANMTGNISTASDRFAMASWHAAAFYLGILGAFIAGALVSALFIHEGRRRAVRGVYAVNILIEGVLIGVLAWAVLTLPTIFRTTLLVMGLSFLMGLQNAVVSTISGTRVRTTHISGMATDVGIELASLMLYAFAILYGDSAVGPRSDRHGECEAGEFGHSFSSQPLSPDPRSLDRLKSRYYPCNPPSSTRTHVRRFRWRPRSTPPWLMRTCLVNFDRWIGVSFGYRRSPWCWACASARLPRS
jgi:Protein of unknown function (DUF1275)